MSRVWRCSKEEMAQRGSFGGASSVPNRYGHQAVLARRAFLALFVSTVMVRATLAGASEGQGAGAPKVYLFNIPAQPLQSALIAFAAVAGLQIMYDAGLARNLRSRAVIGLFSADSALRMLIAGTDLTVVPTGKDVALVPVTALLAGRMPGKASSNGEMTLVLDTLYVSVPPGSEEHPDFNSYGQLVRAKIRKTLTEDSRTARRVYRMDLDIWVDSKGAVNETRVTQSSGTTALDAVLRRVIGGVAIGQSPPAGMRQPIHVTVIGI